MLARIARRLALAGLVAAVASLAAAEDRSAPSMPVPSVDMVARVLADHVLADHVLADHVLADLEILRTQGAPIILAQRRTCRSARSCREAVEMWCGGYSRADGDNDGIPCETVCRSRAQVDEIRRAIGC
ncbi:excalibur calcium-binding domain-containing protein [Salinarimonas sp. NSM]|uniref:excalibur calcium-binding domain-containing protein n=1 Tax=Salinarimonas sp. NSM TaxID=3458003 RepID=UPI0040360EE8